MQINSLNPATLLASQVGKDVAANKPVASPEDAQKIKELSQEFEAIFTEIMLSSMRKSIEKSNVIDGGNAEDIFRGMLDGEYAKLMSKRSSTGIASAIEKDLLKAMQNQMPSDSKAQGIKAYKAESLQPLANQATIGKDKIQD